MMKKLDGKSQFQTAPSSAGEFREGLNNNYYRISDQHSRNECSEESYKEKYSERSSWYKTNIKLDHLSSIFPENETEQGILEYVEESHKLVKVLRQKNLLTPHSNFREVKKMFGHSYINDLIVDGYHQQLKDFSNSIDKQVIQTQDSDSTCFSGTPTGTWLENKQKEGRELKNSHVVEQNGSVEFLKIKTPNNRTSGKTSSTPVAVVTPIQPVKANVKKDTITMLEQDTKFASKIGNSHLYKTLMEMNSLARVDTTVSKPEVSIIKNTGSNSATIETFESFTKKILRTTQVSMHKYCKIKKKLRKEKKARKHLQKQLNVACFSNSSGSEGFRNNSEDVVKLMTLSSLCPHVIHRESHSEPPPSIANNKSECDCPCICDKGQPHIDNNVELRCLLSSMTPALTPILKDGMYKLLEESQNKPKHPNRTFAEVNTINSSHSTRTFGVSLVNDGNINSNSLSLLTQQSSSLCVTKSAKELDAKENESFKCSNTGSLEMNNDFDNIPLASYKKYISDTQYVKNVKGQHYYLS